jgi:uncharacterized Zn finger protein (UPF0148 family)
MKCPNCGFEIPEGHMYCDNCGTEINFVPEFEPEVENEINETLSGVADELNKEERLKQEKKEKRQRAINWIRDRHRIISIAVGVVVFILLCILLIVPYASKSPVYYLRNAESAKNKGQMDTAISTLIEGNKAHPDNSDIVFRMSDYYLESGRQDEAVAALKLITDSALFPEETVTYAYESIISIYEQEKRYEDIAAILNSGDELVSTLKESYIPAKPVMSPNGGTFEDSVVIVLGYSSVNSKENIYYTVNDGVPDSSSIKYENEIAIDAEGEYNIKAVCINEYGIASEVTEYNFVVEKGAPDAPDIMEPSGEYNQNTMIVAVAEAGSTIFYTTDGSEPTIDSKQYISPISMPVGTSHYRFIAIDNEGNVSEIVDRDYHLVYTRLVSTEQAVNSLVSTLVRLDYLLDNTGKVRGIDGHNEYIFNSAIEIEGAGEYYVIVENHVTYDGYSTPTGLLYAVNTHDGSVNRLGYDSSGKYTLLKISNR